MARTAPRRLYNAIPDTLDFRDNMYRPALIEVPPKRDLEVYRKRGIPILDQGSEGACTGYALATVVHYLLSCRDGSGELTCVSPRMLYEMAKRYDEWPGERYEGSSARGAMKGWHRHGVCAEKLWPSRVKKSRRRIASEDEPDPRDIMSNRFNDAARRPLGAYYRVNHKDLVAMHSAIAEAGILYATSTVHHGWEEVGEDGVIPFYEDGKILGGHAFAIVAYDELGFWIQNSWDDTWGYEGFGHLSYDDWLTFGTDVWVARLGAEVKFHSARSTAVSISAAAGRSDAYAFNTLRSHIISIGNNGALRRGGSFGTTEEDLKEIFTRTIPRTFDEWGDGKKKRLLLYAHGGLVSEESAVQRIADYRPICLESGIYPIAFIWKSDYFTTIANMLKDALGLRKSEGLLDSAKDFMLDRLDTALEVIARRATGKAAWSEMKENAMMATLDDNGGARLALDYVKGLARRYKDMEIHIVGHSAGAIFHAPLVARLREMRLSVESCTLWAPACTIETFRKYYLPAIRRETNGVNRFAIYTLSDRFEQDDDCAGIYHKSLLYLVSNAFEDRPHIPFINPDGTPLLGMEKFIRDDEELMELIRSRAIDWVVAPNAEPIGSVRASAARTHSAFDDDTATLRSTLARITASKAGPAIVLNNTAAALRSRRGMLQRGLMG